MQEEKPVVIDTQIDTEVIPEKKEGETTEEKLARLAKLEEINPRLYERAKKAEALAKEYKAKIPLPNTEKPKIEDETVKDVQELKQIEKKRQFGYKNSLSPEETDLLFRFAGSNDPSETLKDEDFKDLLEAKRRRARVLDAIPSGSNRAVSIDGKSFKDMTSDERKKNWSKIVKG